MKTTREELFLLFATPFKESDLIANFLSASEGKLAARIYGGKKIGQNKSFLYHPGDLLNVEYQQKEGSEFVKILNLDAQKLIIADRMPYDKFLFHSYLLELIGRISRVGNPAEDLFQLIKISNQINWVSPYKLLFILWSLWSIIRSGGVAIDYHQCKQCQRVSWTVGINERLSIRKESYQLLPESGQLICNCCLPVKKGVLHFAGATIKLLWLLDQQELFYTKDQNIPHALILELIFQLNRYLLQSYNIKPNSLEMFTQSLEKY
jgi:DNA repair protein RecO